MNKNEKSVSTLRTLFVAVFLAANSPAGHSLQTRDDSPFLYGPNQRNLNVMKAARPTLPNFPALAPKRGTVRGYAKDTRGRPLVGAKIGVRSTTGGGYYSGASATTDSRGYYELQVPTGAVHFYCAGYTMEYGEGRAAFGLHPVDGSADSFSSAQGHVENWVLLPYGIADPDGISDNPGSSLNYYGGTLYLDYSLADPRPVFADDYSLPEGSEIELTLTPEGPLLDGSAGRRFVVRKKVEEQSTYSLILNNIPIGRYTIEARLSQGGKSLPLRVVETGPNAGQPFGLSPKETRGKAHLTFRPDSAKPEYAKAQRGNWASLSIKFKR